MNSGQEIAGELVVSGRDAAEVLEPAETALDDISAFVGASVEAMVTTRLDLLGITGLAPRRRFRREGCRHHSLVGEERAHGRGERQNIGRSRDIGILARGQMQDDGPAERIAQRMDFCCAASARSADGLIVLPPFPPEAQR